MLWQLRSKFLLLLVYLSLCSSTPTGLVAVRSIHAGRFGNPGSEERSSFLCKSRVGSCLELGKKKLCMLSVDCASSLTCPGLCCSIVLEVLFIVSTFVVGLEIFVGITAIAGVFCIFSELLLVGSLFLFRPDVQVTEVTETFDQTVTSTTAVEPAAETAAIAEGEQAAAVAPTPSTAAVAEAQKVLVSKASVHFQRTVRTEVREPSKFEQVYADAHRTLLILFIVNVQFVPFILLLVPFCLCGLKWADASAHWFGASVLPRVYLLFLQWCDLTRWFSVFALLTAACLSIAAYTLAYAYIKAQIIARARRIADRDATQLKMWKSWYSAVLVRG